MHSHYLSVPFPVSLLCSFQPVGQQKQGEAAHGILPLKCSQNAKPSWRALLSVPSLGDISDAHVLFCCPSAPGAKDPSQHLVSHAHIGTVVSKWFGNQWCCPRRSVTAEGGGPGLVGRVGAGGARWALLGTGNWWCLQSRVRTVTQDSLCSYLVITTCFNTVGQ